MKTEVIFGIHPVAEALKAGRRTFTEIYAAAKRRKADRATALLNQARQARIPVKTLSPKALDETAGTDAHQGIAALVSAYPVLDGSRIPGLGGPPEKEGFLLILDRIMDPHNFGALIRTAVCAGAAGIIIPKHGGAPVNPLASRISAGALEHARVFRVTNLTDVIQALKTSGYWVAGMDRNGSESLFTWKFSGPTALVMGGEQKGVRRLVRENCDLMISIPQQGPVDSLNVSVAGGVVMYEIFRQQRLRKAP